MFWPLKYVRIISVQAALALDNNDAPARHFYRIVMPIFPARRLPIGNVPAILHMVEYAFHKIALAEHLGRNLTADALDRALQNSARIEIILGEAVSAKRVGFGS